jgi:hypothetical protein
MCYDCIKKEVFALAFVFYSNEGARPSETAYITVDKQGRIYINRLAQKELGITSLPIELYVAYDKDSKMIGLSADSSIVPEGTKPFRFNGNRAYASAKSFLQDARILPRMNEDAHRYFYVGKIDGLHAFAREVPQEVGQADEQEPEPTFEQEAQESAATLEVTNEVDETSEQLEKIKAALSENPEASFRQLERMTGISRKNISRLVKEYKLR